jgi:hypothetical protein
VDTKIMVVIVAIVMIAIVGVWYLVNVGLPGSRMIERNIKAMSVVSCDVSTNNLTIMSVGDVDIEPTELKIYYAAEETGLSGFITDVLHPEEITTIQFSGGSFEAGKEYFVRAEGIQGASITC